MMIPTGGDGGPAMPQNAADPQDSPEEIAKDAEGDLKDARFYNRPGATRAAFNDDWQQCRLIARGSRTPTGMIPYHYNPALVSPVAIGVGGLLGGLIAGAIAQGQQRRANRRNCLMIRGWRLVDVPPADAARVAAMTPDQRRAHFDTMIGAQTVPGTVTERTRFSLAPDAALRLDAPLTQPATLWLGKKVDAAAPFALAPGEGAIVVAFRRVDPSTAGRSASVSLLRYDIAHRDVMFQPKDWKKTGDKTTYTSIVPSHDKTSAYEVQVVRVTPGDYVINSLSLNNQPHVTTHCFGAPTFAVAAGQVVYLGDFSPYTKAPLTDGSKLTTLIYSSHPDDARRLLAARQPALAGAMVPADLRNQATYSCAGQDMTRWDIDGAAALAPAAPEVLAPAR
ncbi:MAG: hypothetical protein PGN23_02025 [Sphingomonas adhaesiva]|uniref:hypothetical protein n=1 Tax=Sphingomonas adhaesiva TaxID=28212 RepID=UPI002FF56887